MRCFSAEIMLLFYRRGIRHSVELRAKSRVMRHPIIRFAVNIMNIDPKSGVSRSRHMDLKGGKHRPWNRVTFSMQIEHGARI